MKCVIMQPTYMPWAGYLNLISQADIFVFLDDVQYEQRSWQSRNRILLNGQPRWITVPVRCLSQLQVINTIQIDDEQKWRHKHFQLIKQSYTKHPYIEEVLEVVKIILDTTINSLADLNIQLIQAFSANLGIFPQFKRASDLNVSGKRSEHLFKICQSVGCDEYLSPVGSTQYLMEDGVFDNSSIRLLFQDYIPTPYPQMKSDSFLSHLSIIDVVANLGWQQASKYVLSSYR